MRLGATIYLAAPACVGLLLCGGCAERQYDEVAPGAAASYFPLAIGDRWTYEYVPGGHRYDSTVSETRAIGGVTTYALTIGQSYAYMAVQPNGVYQYAQGVPGQPSDAVVFDPPQLLYKLPFKVGDSWNTPALLEPGKARSPLVQVYGRVESLENVAVPAGHFPNCARILYDDPRDAPSDQTEIWIAANVGIVKTKTYIQRDGNRPPRIYETQLVSYNVR